MGVEEGHVTIETSQVFHAHVTLLEMSVVCGEGIRATGAPECPTRRDLYNQITNNNDTINARDIPVGWKRTLSGGFLVT